MYGRSWTKDLLGAVGAVAVPYLGATMAKATGKPLTSALVTTGAGVVGVIAKGSIRDPNWHEFVEGGGYGGLGYFGTWLAANTPTIGGKAAGPIPLQDMASSGSAAAAIAAARFTVTEDLPTPPLPLAIAYTLVSDAGLANGISRSGAPPRSLPCSSRRCSSLITSRSTRTCVTPARLPTAACTFDVIVSRSGQPETVSQTSTRTAPPGPTSTFLTMPSSVIGRWISGSWTPASAVITCSVLGPSGF